MWLSTKHKVRHSHSIKPWYFVGYCRSQGYSGKDPRNLHPAFKEIAELTSGQALLLKDHWELEKLSDLTGGVLDGTNVISFGSNLSGRQKRNVGGGGRYRIPVDESIEKITVTVTTTRIGTKGCRFFFKFAWKEGWVKWSVKWRSEDAFWTGLTGKYFAACFSFVKSKVLMISELWRFFRKKLPRRSSTKLQIGAFGLSRRHFPVLAKFQSLQNFSRQPSWWLSWM